MKLPNTILYYAQNETTTLRFLSPVIVQVSTEKLFTTQTITDVVVVTCEAFGFEYIGKGTSYADVAVAVSAALTDAWKVQGKATDEGLTATELEKRALFLMVTQEQTNQVLTGWWAS